MFYGRACAFWTLAVATLLAHPADGQSVISTHSGIIHFFEGAVYLDDQPLESHPGKFSSVPEGAELRTAEGRAEVLLTPDVFVRIGQRTTIRMVANKLSDTRVELLAGSAVVDSAEPGSGTSVTLIYRNWNVRFFERGVYRIDSDPPRLWVLQGTAEVSAVANQGALLVKQGMYVPFAPVLVPERSIDEPRDAFSTWAEGRQQSISADNAIAANIQDPASMNTSGLDSFTYFPMLGLSAMGPGLSSTYSSLGPDQPGFNSIYLPGYTYLPLFLGLGLGGFRTPLGLPPYAGISPFPRATGPRSIPVRPISPMRPISPIRPISPARPVSPVGIHAGVHR
ncbi:MAG TPA: hypothetical protein VK788_14260 [Terriglobales bacterium]|nr:hypothetical protein [Terriglobales bacterium]